jgi:ADP-ribosylglycohydrolase
MTRRHETNKTNGKRTQAKAVASTMHRRIKAMAAAGLVEDQIALRIGGDKNQLRRRYIDSIKAGRNAKAQEKAAAEAAEVSRSERARLAAIIRTFDSHWYSKETGNLIFGCTHSVADALAWCRERDGGGPCRWITTGLSEDDLADEYDVAQYLEDQQK